MTSSPSGVHTLQIKNKQILGCHVMNKKGNKKIITPSLHILENKNTPVNEMLQEAAEMYGWIETIAQ